MPQFYSKLFQKYQQMQDATQNADQMDKEELVEILRNYLRIFKDLDAEFEKFFITSTVLSFCAS